MQQPAEIRIPFLIRHGFPHFSSLQRQTEEFWNAHEVRSDHILPRLRQADYVLDKLDHLDSRVVRSILSWAEVDIDNLNDEGLAELIAGRADEVWVETLFLLMEFCEKRRFESFRTSANWLLGDDAFLQIDGQFEQLPSNRLVLALRVFCEDVNKLKFLSLWHYLDNRSYRRYQLRPNIERLDDEDMEIAGRRLAAINDKIRNGIDDLTQITAERINDLLVAFETHNLSNKTSFCDGVLLTDNDQVCWVFIKRQYRPNRMPEVRRTVFADEAELIIVQLRNRLAEMDIKFEQRETLDYMNSVAAHLLDADVQYVPYSETTSREQVEGLFEALLTNADHTLKLIEVESHTLPLPDAIRLTVRGNYETGISLALRALKEMHGLDLVGDLLQIESIKVTYSISRRRNSAYMVTIYFSVLSEEEGFYLSYTTRASLADRTLFEADMQDHYGITIIPRPDDTNT